jgi:glycine/D-amino acid oxidase-like deaminating enzyme
MDKKTSEPEILKLTPPPKITKENTLGTVYGIRPYRVGGYRLARDDIKGKAIFHNYGHGGAGASLAPGCAKRIVDKFLIEMGPKVDKVGIIGAGYMGLFQSIMLADLGYKVSIYADNFVQKDGFYKGKPVITSQVAGGYWMPFGCDFANKPLHDAISKESWEWYVDCIAKKKYKGLRYHDVILMDYENPIPTSIPKGLIEWRKVKVDFGNGDLHDAEVFNTVLMDGDTFLNELVEEAKSKGVKFHERTFKSLDDVVALEEEAIFNCTGGGSYKLFDDKNIVPIAGHLIYLKPVPGVNYFLCHVNQKGWSVTTYPQMGKLGVGLAYEKIGWITEPVKETLDNLVNNMNEFVQKKSGPRPKL